MGDYYPSLEELKEITSQKSSNALMTKAQQALQIKSGFIQRSDGMNVDETLEQIESRNSNGLYSGLISRLKSVMDLSPNLYKEFADNPNSIGNWFPEIVEANGKASCPFEIPKTQIWKLPIELAQFIRLEYSETTQRSRELFNKMIFDKFNLSDDTEYFIKTGTFSSKFEFRNAHVNKGEAKEMGEYFQVINNFAMQVGAGHSIEVCVREYIQDIENNPTIYSGMPLRTEFRVFVDFNSNQIIGIVPYWNPIVMKRAFSSEFAPDTIKQDYRTYCNHESKLMKEYNEYLSLIKKKVRKLIPHVNLNGKYSIDIMKNGKDFYLIDMATMETSALTELL